MEQQQRFIDDLKDFNGQKYSGMSIGSSHFWDYTNAKWEEQKIKPDLWNIKFTSVKQRTHKAPEGSGVPTGTEYHWYVLGSQMVKKLDANSYTTELNGLKFKIGHKRPYWKEFSYKYPGQLTERERVIQALETELERLKCQMI